MIFTVLHTKQVLQYETALQEITDTSKQYIGREWLGDIGIGSALIAFYLMLTKGTGREQDHRNMTGGGSAFDALAEFQTVHDGHHDVRNNQIGYNLIGNSKSLLPISSLIHLVSVLKDGTEIGTYIGIVVNN